jgi:hypothetical protein
MLGTLVGYFLTGEIGGRSWTVSICAGIGFACGTGTARALFRR